MKMTVTVNNLPESLEKYSWITARLWDGELWFYTAWQDEQSARECALVVDGLAVKVEVIA